MALPSWRIAPSAAILLAGLATATSADSSANGYELNPRLNLVGGSGRPTNDVLGVGLAIRRHLGDGWFLGLNVDYSAEFDFEEPYRIVGIRRQSGTTVVDAVGTMLMLSAIAEKRYPLDRSGWQAFWNVGGGVAEIDMDDADGPVAGGGSFAIETDAGTELIVLGGAGFMQQLGENWSARYELTYEYHEGGWDLRDRISGKTGEVDDYDLFGLRLGLSRRF